MLCELLPLPLLRRATLVARADGTSTGSMAQITRAVIICWRTGEQQCSNIFCKDQGGEVMVEGHWLIKKHAQA